MHRAWRFALDESAVETVENAIVAGLVVSGLVALFAAIGLWVFKRYKRVGRVLFGADP